MVSYFLFVTENAMGNIEMEIYTIGYEGLTPKHFLSMLNRYEISIVADVRQLPLSRKQGFSKRSLSESLANENIRYVSFSRLGTTKEMRNELKETGDYATLFNKYRKSIVGKYEDLDEICALLKSNEKVALLCFEHDPNYCHRKIVAEEVRKRDGNGLKIKHIQPII